MNRIVLFLIIIAPFLGSAQLHILSGLENGTYSQLAHDIKHYASTPVVVSTSEGSVDNYNRIVNDTNVHLTFLQYDVLLAKQESNPSIREDLQILLPLYFDEEIHLITRTSLGIHSTDDLKGKKVAVGSENQGTYITATMIKQKLGAGWEDVKIKSVDAVDALLKGEVSAFFYVGGAPIAQLTNLKMPAHDTLKILPIKSNAKLSKIYSRKEIKPNTYAWQPHPVSTYAIETFIVVNARHISNDRKEALKKLFYDIKKNMFKLQQDGHPKWKNAYYKNAKNDWVKYNVFSN